jgi:hypothetical protein
MQQESSRPPAPELSARPGTPLFLGVLGGGCAHPGRANLRLIRRAIRAGWPIPADKRRALVDHLLGVVRAGNARSAIAAAWCLLAADRVNMRLEREALAESRGPIPERRRRRRPGRG